MEFEIFHYPVYVPIHPHHDASDRLSEEAHDQPSKKQSPPDNVKKDSTDVATPPSGDGNSTAKDSLAQRIPLVRQSPTPGHQLLHQKEPRVSPKEARDFLIGNFDILDKNNDGFVEVTELRELNTPDPKDAAAREFLMNNIKEITTNVRHAAAKTDGITKADMVHFAIEKDPDYAANQLLVKQMERSFDSNLSNLDTNKDGHLNETELASAAADPSLDVGAKYMVEFLRRSYPLASSINSKSQKSWFDDFTHPMDPAADTMHLGVGKDDMARISTEYSVDSANGDARSKAMRVSSETSGIAFLLTGSIYLPPVSLTTAGIVGVVTYGAERVHSLNASNNHRVTIAKVLDSMSNVSRLGACE